MSPLTLIDGNTQTGGATVQSSTRKMLLNEADVATALYVRFTPNVPAHSQSTDDLATWPTATDASAAGGTLQFDVYYRRWDDRTEDNVVDLFYDGDATDDGLYHRQLNLDTMVFGTEHWITGGVIGHPSIEGMSGVRALSGRLYSSGGGTFLYPPQVWYSDDEGATWAGPIAVAFVEDDSGDYCTLWPDYSSADTNDLSGIFWDASASQISVKRLDASVPSITETVIASSMTASATQTNISSAVAENGHIRVAAFDGANPGTLKTWDVYGATVTAKTNVLTSIADVSCVAVQILDEHDWTVIFYQRAGEIFYKISTDQMATWGTEQSYGDASANDYISIQADPRPANSLVAAMFYEASSRDLWTVAPAVPVDAAVEQFRLMLAETATPDVPTLNITSQNFGNVGDVLVEFERGKDASIFGNPSRAGELSYKLDNRTAGYLLDEPNEGLGTRLNKRIGDTWYHLSTCDITVPETHFGRRGEGFRSIKNVRAIGRLARLQGKTISTELYGRGWDAGGVLDGVTTGEAIEHLLDAVGIDPTLYDIDAGDVTLPYWWANAVDAKSALDQLVAAEGITAELYEDGAGRICFRSRSARFTNTVSTTIQQTLRSAGTAPQLADFEYKSGSIGTVVNSARATRIARHNDTGPTVVWEDDNGDGNYILGPPGTPTNILTLEAIAAEPFFDAIVPVLNTDYEIGLGSVTVTLERTSGQRTLITFTAGAGGASIGGVGADNITLRATTTIAGSGDFNGEFTEVSSVDASESIRKHGPRPWQGTMWPDMQWADMRDNLDAIVTWLQEPIGRVIVTINSVASDAANTACATLDIGHRIRVIESNPSIELDCEAWIERIHHRVYAPAGSSDGSIPGRELTTYECPIISVGVGSTGGGTGLGEDNPYDDIDNEDFILPTTGLADQGMVMRGLVGPLFGAGP